MVFQCQIAKQLLQKEPQSIMDKLEAKLEEMMAAKEALKSEEAGTEDDTPASA